MDRIGRRYNALAPARSYRGKLPHQPPAARVAAHRGDHDVVAMRPDSFVTHRTAGGE
jgi:hypothetical protein